MDAMKVILSFVLGFIFAQGVKAVISLIKGEKRILKRIARSGGMPSGHTASTMAAAINVGVSSGFDSVVFGLAMVMVFIVVYDALNVRYAVGEQGKILNQLIRKPIRVVEGHKMIEVLVGAVLGVIIGLLVSLI